MTKSARVRNILQAYINFLFVILIATLSIASLRILKDSERLDILGYSGLMSLGFLGMWRWGWAILQLIRSHIYLYIVFPHWRRKAKKIPVEQLPPVCLLVPTYKEEPWITKRVFSAIAKEAKTLAYPITILITSSSNSENAEILNVLKSVDPELSRIRVITQVQTGEGKRKAMANGLRELARLNLPKHTIVALMDGDSEITPGTLRGCLPFFCMFPKMGALTTDELPIVNGSYLFSEWFHLRLSQRHHQMSSVSLSSKIMCLTGRFSLFRAEAALDPTFADKLETDTLDDWLWGRFKFLSGDDKSTWYWLLQRGYDMIYVPDVIVYSIETISGSFTNRAYQNMRRWFGNMLRNSDRAISLGPGKAGWFMWFCLLDQRISFWTSLVTPGILIITLLQFNWLAVVVILCWVFFTRSLVLTIIFWRRDSYLKPIHLPMLLISQWSAAIVKIWTQMNLAQQKWTNRGSQSISAEGTGFTRFVKLGTSRFLYFSQLFGLAVALSWLAGIINPPQMVSGLRWSQEVSYQPPPTQIIIATDYGVIPSDSRDDSQPLQKLIDKLPPQNRIEINLPIGEIDLYQPLVIARSDTILKGEGRGRTILVSHASQNQRKAVIIIKPPSAKISTTRSQSPQLGLKSNQITPANNVSLAGASTPIPTSHNLHHIDLEGFTLHYPKPAPSLDSIVLENVTQSTIKNIHLQDGSRHSLILRNTENITLEYVTIDSKSETKQIIKTNAVNTQIKGLTVDS
ncbi:MAG TPA: transcriptional regulator [Cyanobacteria bacterium UBA11149]|nr:transcriptional regulator [Cyanobacteria bacterium UBA11367]HBE56399.1 transcriptional regulator [Cyanobacteria bacterium UBA11366]HBK66618.1 transcriptional regulator [Cyanobacteria bacterium UBA11166]HBR76348.1 transcriptional regulator [Cyanobacteria bacterium UBA11159]HBS71544.1 transcriptional regulator [Cyanobacteria bacterium UBA11153]HBW88813.1 transcriptional regulator [Cyanobacteria bacterium UBA11149]HCA94184.1 transcriptional regulator [Cyanobacteria bacterium UBA9226]